MLCNNCKHDIPLFMGFAYAKGTCPYCGADFLSDAKGLAIQTFYNELFTCFGEKLDMNRIFVILDFIYSPGSELIIESLKGHRDAFNEISASVTGEGAENPPSQPLAAKEISKPPKKVSRRIEAASKVKEAEERKAPSRRAPANYVIPEAELSELPDDLKDFGRNVKTKADYDMFLKMLAGSMSSPQGE